jgi:ketosteroid isomerase-like protein
MAGALWSRTHPCLILLACTTLLVSGCTASSPPSAATRPTGVTAPQPVTETGATVTIDEARVRQIAAVVSLLDAYARGDAAGVLAHVTTDIVWSDCDYTAGRAVELHGIEQARRWLASRFAARDRLVLQAVSYPESGDARVVGVSFSHRSNSEIAAKGHPDGIRPRIAAKIIFAAEGSAIESFAAGPVGGDQALCRP